MSQDLLKKLVSDSETYKSKITKTTAGGKAGTDSNVLQQSKKIRKEDKQKPAEKRVLGDKFKSIVKKMKVSTDKNLILEKNLKYLQTMKKKTKVSPNVAKYLMERLNTK
jgi:hypothetical protein